MKKLSLGAIPTPVEHLPRLSAALGGPQIYVKRDDYTCAALGGNKVRKLEYLLADALEKKADVILTCGGVQSNHARITAGLCAKLGLKCCLVLMADEPADPDGNLLLDRIYGADVRFAGSGGFEEAVYKKMEEAAAEYRAKGHVTYSVPLGGASPVGCLGYVECMDELLAQGKAPGVKFTRLVVADGSGGTHAGLETGRLRSGAGVQVVGVSVLFDKKTISEHVNREIAGTMALLGLKGPVPEITVYDDYLGPGYAKPDDRTIEAMKLFGAEGVILDPVYTGKAAAGLVDLCRKKAFGKDDTVLFLHTGGYPGMAVLKKKYRELLYS